MRTTWLTLTIVAATIACSDDSSNASVDGSESSDGGSENGDGDGESSSGDGDGESGDGDGDSGDGDGDGDGDSGDGDGDACEPITDDPSEIGNDCGGGVACGPGYTCQPFAGFVLQESCQIICTQDCECPDTYSCVPIQDKGNQWMQCQNN
jgi:hypothetical protein